MFLLLQLISRGKKDGAALFPDKKARREGKESGGGGKDLKCQYSHEIFRMGLPPLPSSRAVVFIGPNCGIRTLSIRRVTVRIFKLHRILQSGDKIKPPFTWAIA